MFKPERILQMNNYIIDNCKIENKYKEAIKSIGISIYYMTLMRDALINKKYKSIRVLSYIHNNDYFYVFVYKKRGKKRKSSQGYLYTIKKGYFEAKYLGHYELDNYSVLYSNENDVLCFIEKMLKNKKIQLRRLKEKYNLLAIDYEVIEKKEEKEDENMHM